MTRASTALEALRLMFITDAQHFGLAPTLAAATALCKAAPPGGAAILVRDPSLSAPQRLALARQLRAVTRAGGQLLFVADRLDLAVLGEADGVHLGERSVDVASAREWLSRTAAHARLLSRAWHPPSEPEPGADLYLASPVVAARKGTPPLGYSGLQRELGSRQGLCVFALGGVDAASVRSCRASGAQGVAVIGEGYRDPVGLAASVFG